MNFQAVVSLLIIVLFVRNAPSLDQCYYCADSKCHNMRIENCSEPKNQSCIATIHHRGHEDNEQTKGCSNQTECEDEDMSQGSDCYVCEENLCNKDPPKALFCYTCVDEGCTKSKNIDVKKCIYNNTDSATGFYCYIARQTISMDIFGKVDHRSAGCVTKKYVNILQSTCNVEDERWCKVCDNSLCNEISQAKYETTTAETSSTTEDIDQISFGITEDMYTSTSARSNEATCLILAPFVIVVTVLS